MKFLLLALLSFNLYAGDTCLQRVSNQDLLDELSFRMAGTTRTPRTQFTDYHVFAHCGTTGYLTIEVVELFTGKKWTRSWQQGVNTCDNTAESIMKKFPNGYASHANTQVALCSNNYLEKVIIHVGLSSPPRGRINSVGSTRLRSASACISQMDRINGTHQ